MSIVHENNFKCIEAKTFWIVDRDLTHFNFETVNDDYDVRNKHFYKCLLFPFKTVLKESFIDEVTHRRNVSFWFV